MLEHSHRYAPLVTPFTDDGYSLSEARVARLVRTVRSWHAEGVVVASEVGEFSTLALGERKQLLEWVMRDRGDLKVLVHLSTVGTSAALDLARHANEIGASGGILMPPYYGRYTASEMIAHFKSIASHSGLPIIVVDPFQVIESSVPQALAAIPGLEFAGPISADWAGRVGKGHARSEELVHLDVQVSPLFGIPEVPEAAEILTHFGRTRAMKALLNEAEIEVGPPRAPMQPVPVESLHKFRTTR